MAIREREPKPERQAKKGRITIRDFCYRAVLANPAIKLDQLVKQCDEAGLEGSIMTVEAWFNATNKMIKAARELGWTAPQKETTAKLVKSKAA